MNIKNKNDFRAVRNQKVARSVSRTCPDGSMGRWGRRGGQTHPPLVSVRTWFPTCTLWFLCDMRRSWEIAVWHFTIFTKSKIGKAKTHRLCKTFIKHMYFCISVVLAFPIPRKTAKCQTANCQARYVAQGALSARFVQLF